MKNSNVFERMLDKLNTMPDDRKLIGIAIMTGLFLVMLGLLTVTLVLGSK
jgi:hypothetical protein